ncbi:MAG: ELWxxDGT repeat protein [Caldilineaceae bacterium]
MNPTLLAENGDIITESSDPHYFSAFGNRLLFAATDGVNGYQLWATDEAATSTVRLKAVTPHSPIIMSNGIGFFAADDGEHGIELWRTDGTSEGTQLVADINPGLPSSIPYGFVDVNGVLFFLVKQGDAASKLWKSDGTTAGTQLVTARVSPYIVTHVNNQLYLAAGNFQGFKFQLWVSDGTDAGTVLLKDFGQGTAVSNPDIAYPLIFRYFDPFLAVVADTLFFRADDGLHGVELWKSDGTPEGTVLVQDLLPGPEGSYLEEFTIFQGMFFFPTSAGLMKSDGTAAGTQLVKAGVATSQFQPVGDLLFLIGYDEAYGLELWRSDGTTDGTFLVKDINPAKDTYIRHLMALNGKAILLADDGLHGPQLWQSDGTANGTTLMTAIIPAPQLGTNLFATAGNRLFFPAYDDQHGVELWISDGTDAGTRLVADINQQPDLSNGPLQTLAVVKAGSDRSAHIPITYVNQSQDTQSQVTLTAVLGDGLTYLASSSPVTPTIQGNTLVWQLPALAPFASGEVTLQVQAPTAPPETRYPVTLTLATVTNEAAPIQNSATIAVRLVAYTYLPIITR